MTHRGPFQPLLFCDSVIQMSDLNRNMYRYDFIYLLKVSFNEFPNLYLLLVNTIMRLYTSI